MTVNDSLQDSPCVITTSAEVTKLTIIPKVLGCPVRFVRRKKEVESLGKIKAVLAWGNKPSALYAEKMADSLGLPLWRLEDGFVHSLGQGVLGDVSCSLVVDKHGIYYDATTPSDLEITLNNFHLEQPAYKKLYESARKLMPLAKRAYVTKYNNAPLTIEHLHLPVGEKVLVVDQTAGDMSLQYGLVDGLAHRDMLKIALDEHPDATVLVKSHPDVLVGKKRGFLDLSLKNHPRIELISEPVNTMVLLSEVKHVYVATSQLGFEALIAGKTVSCFGVPFYAGWGVTDDRADKELPVFKRRKVLHDVFSLFSVAYLSYSHYMHPVSGEECEFDDIVDHFSLQNDIRMTNASGGGGVSSLYGLGLYRAFWKQRYIRQVLASPPRKVRYITSWKKAVALGIGDGVPVFVWGLRNSKDIRYLSELGHPIWRLEDGFIRSVGLGSDLAPPLSLVLDKRGIYFDPRSPSDLEVLLQTYCFDDALLKRARKLRSVLLEASISKYNGGDELDDSLVRQFLDKHVVFVPGQVEDDASIQVGCYDIRTNKALLEAVRARKPDSFILYKPHPDVLSGNRRGKVDQAHMDSLADLVLYDSSITACLAVADEVHTMTSLVGFEALLRDIPVFCYGVPFYAGWGLTYDQHSISRRSRKLTIDQVVAATLILYPRYIHWESGSFTTPEATISYLEAMLERQGGKRGNRLPWLVRKFRQILWMYKGLRYRVR